MSQLIVYYRWLYVVHLIAVVLSNLLIPHCSVTFLTAVHVPNHTIENNNNNNDNNRNKQICLAP